jgi:membrane protease YdiL (CAAX protease family)
VLAEKTAPISQFSRSSAVTSIARRVFFTHDGLRARWRLLLFAVLWAFCERALFAGAAPLFGYAQRSPLPSLLIWSLSFLAVVIPTAVMARIEHQPLGSYGLPARSAFGVLFWKGAAWGLVALTGRMLALRAVGAFYFGGLALHGRDVIWYGVSWALVFLMIPLFELLMLLGYPQAVLTDRIGFWPTAAALSFFFGATHLVNGGLRSGRFALDWTSGLFTGMLALFFFLTLRRTGNLWFGVGVETFFNWGDTFLYSVPDNGQQAPGHLLSSHVQGSPSLTGGAGILDFVMLMVLLVAFHRKYPNALYPTGRAHKPSADKAREQRH